MSKRGLRSSHTPINKIEPLDLERGVTFGIEKKEPRDSKRKSKNAGNVTTKSLANTNKGNKMKISDVVRSVEKEIVGKVDTSVESNEGDDNIKTEELKSLTRSVDVPSVPIKKRRIVETFKSSNNPDEIESGGTKVKTKRVKKSKFTGESMEQKRMRETVGVMVLDSASLSKKNLGFHVSAAGGLEQAIYNARSEGCRSFAFFLRNQRQWNSTPIDEETVERWHQVIKETDYPIHQIIPHGSYLINPGSPNEEKLAKSRACMLDECQRAERLGILYYNFHPGSTTGECNREECVRTVASTINYIIENTKSIIMVIETMAGQGHTVGGKFEEIRDMIDQVTNKLRVGVCIDTCHIFAAGYDIRTKKAYDNTMKQFDEIIGFKYLKALHINDSKGDLGCRLDRHEHIAKGKIGKAAFGFIMDDARLDNIPLVLETPEGEYPKEMMLMYGIQTKH